MDKILLILVAFNLFSCAPDSTENLGKYKTGDIVYLKPDSTKAVIWQTSRVSTRLGVSYIDSLGVRHSEIILIEEVYK